MPFLAKIYKSHFAHAYIPSWIKKKPATSFFEKKPKSSYPQLQYIYAGQYILQYECVLVPSTTGTGY